jgi:TolB-like protein
VKTVPKKGYQFIAPVSVVDEHWQAKATAPPSASPPRWMLPGWVLLVLGAVVLVGLGIGLTRPRAALTVAIARFDNQTGQVAGDLLTEQVTDSLVQELSLAGSGRYGVIGNAPELRVPRTQRNPKVISGALNAGYLVVGQLQPEGDGQVVIASLIRMPEQTHIGVGRVTLGPGTDQRETARQIAARFNGVLQQEAAGHRASSVPNSR